MKTEWIVGAGVAIVAVLLAKTASAAVEDSTAGDFPYPPDVGVNGAGADPEVGTTTSGGVTPATRELALAIAHAEGFGVAGAIPTRAHNPGDLVIPGWTGPTLGDQRISVFTSDADGWNRLYHQLDLIANERSHVYTLDDTFADFGAKWTQTQSGEWTDNVVNHLVSKGYDIDAYASLREFFSA